MLSDRATLEETLEFANKVRKAGGGAVLHALMPAVPTDSSQCLIAKNLNFNCRVSSFKFPDGWAWGMKVNDIEVGERIAHNLDLKYFIGHHRESLLESPQDVVYIKLPEQIGAVADAFDITDGLLSDIDSGMPLSELTADDKQLLRDFLPYIEESVKEAYDLASLVNEDGSIVI